MSKDKRRFTRTDRPGSGIYQGEASPGIAFDDYRAADEHEIHHRHEHLGYWRRLRELVFSSLYPLANDQIVEKAKAALGHDSTLDTSHVQVSAEEGTVSVKGSVPSHWMKERISDCLLNMSGVSSIRNELQIRPDRSKLPQEGTITA